jgi:uncharacterized RmlC-like cupin family protein
MGEARPRIVREQDLTETDQTPGMIRRAAFVDPGIWVGTARTAPGAVSGWHRHGDNTTYIYCVAGAIRVESGPGGRAVDEARAGEFILIPPNLVHRERNPTEVEALILLTRIGSGPVLTNVEGPPN